MNDWQKWVFYGSAAVVLAYLVAGIFETVFYDSEITMMVYFVMALPFVRFPDPQNRDSSASQPQADPVRKPSLRQEAKG